MSDHWSPADPEIRMLASRLREMQTVATCAGILAGILLTLGFLVVLGVIHLPPLRIGCP